MSEMLINATHSEEMRIAVIENGPNAKSEPQLCYLLLEPSNREQKKANIYKGRITRIEPSLEAAFVDFGQNRHGFLPFKEITTPNGDRSNIRQYIQEGQEILVQVEKEERGNKGAALSSFISLAGSYLVLMPNNPSGGGVSRRIEGDERNEIREILASLSVPAGMSVIIRTAGVGRSKEELEWDLNYLLTLWNAIKVASESDKAPFLVYQESDTVFRAIRDYLRANVSAIIVDDEQTYEKIRKHMSLLRPDFVENVRLYSDTTPLFTRYQIESQIETVFQREVRLPSGGSIVIDRTEALVAIDVNSSQATRGGDIEETALQTNLEAADEIARQLRLRDLGGLIVVDFIDMTPTKHQRDVEDRFFNAIQRDRARIQAGRISRFGLLELSRQRLRSSVGETTQEICPRCHGRGSIRGIESLSISIMRLIEENAVKENTAQVHTQVPVEVATYLLNEKRREINALEAKHQVLVFVIPNPHLKTPDFDIIRIKSGTSSQQTPLSYKLIEEERKLIEPVIKTTQEERDVPAVRDITPTQPAPSITAATPMQPIFKSLMSKLIKMLKPSSSKEEKKRTERQGERRTHNRQGGNKHQQSQRRNNMSNRQGGGGNKQRRQGSASGSGRRHGGQSRNNPSSEYRGFENRSEPKTSHVELEKNVPPTISKQQHHSQIKPAEGQQATTIKQNMPTERVATPVMPPARRDEPSHIEKIEPAHKAKYDDKVEMPAAKKPVKENKGVHIPLSPISEDSGMKQVETTQQSSAPIVQLQVERVKPVRPEKRAIKEEVLEIVETKKG